MKIKTLTITCHDVYNYGALLQAYALQQYLILRGYDNEIINYKPPYLSGHYNMFKIGNSKWAKNILLKIIYVILKFPYRLISLKRKKAFDKFTKNYLKVTTHKYANNEDLKNNCPIADAYIAGSDQIWNTLFPNGKDPAFYLDFVPEGKRKISYAASFATDKIENGYVNFVKELVSKIDYISVREQNGKEILNNLGIDKVTHVADPVFLLSTDQWDKISAPSFSEKYILIYETENKDALKNPATIIAKTLKLPIYGISSFRLDYAKRNFCNAGPSMFLSLIKNTEFVISNSFHGTAFALIYKKRFIVMNRSEAINSRMANLLAYIGLENHLINGKEFNANELIKPIEYNNVEIQLNTLIDISKQFLAKSLRY